MVLKEREEETDWNLSIYAKRRQIMKEKLKRYITAMEATGRILDNFSDTLSILKDIKDNIKHTDVDDDAFRYLEKMSLVVYNTIHKMRENVETQKAERYRS